MRKLNRIICLILFIPVPGIADEAPAGETPAAEAPSYVGVETCKICHMPHFDSWKLTRMSQAFELLKPGARVEAKQNAGLDPQHDYTADPICLPCHTTGYGQPGGFISVEKTPDMVGVQCEMCHGPGSVFAQMMLVKRGCYTREDYIARGGMTMPSEETNVCTQKCHNIKSPFIGSGFVFNFEDRKASGTHRHDLRYIDMPFDWFSDLSSRPCSTQ